jgi:hypothetical protein
MAVQNILAYYGVATITVVKSFIVQALESNHLKPFWTKFTFCFYKLDRFRVTKHMFSDAEQSSLQRE